MNASEVPDELVELAEPALREMLATEGVFVPVGHPRLDHVGRRILAAVLPLYGAALMRERDAARAETAQYRRDAVAVAQSARRIAAHYDRDTGQGS